MWPLFFLTINVVLTDRKNFICKTVSVKPGGTCVYTNHQALRGQEMMARVHIVRMKRQYSFLCHRPLWKFTHLFPPMGNSTLLATVLRPLSATNGPSKWIPGLAQLPGNDG